MGRYLLKQPNGYYCVWSTITDSPVAWNLTKEDLYEKDYFSITRPTYGEYLKHDVDKAIGYVHVFDKKDKWFPSIVYNMEPDEFKEFLSDIGSELTLDDFAYVDGYTKCNDSD